MPQNLVDRHEIPLLDVDGDSRSTSLDNVNLLNLYREARNSVVKVRAAHRGETWNGTGFAITQDGAIVTDFHVVEGSAGTTVTTADGATYPAVVLAVDRESDLAILKTPMVVNPLKLSDNPNAPESYEKLSSLGYPLGASKLHVSFGTHQYSQLLRDIVGDIRSGAASGENTDRLIFSERMRVKEGESGAPIFSMKTKQVVGVVDATDERAVAIATPVKEIHRALAKNNLKLANDLSRLIPLSRNSDGILANTKVPDGKAQPLNHGLHLEHRSQSEHGFLQAYSTLGSGALDVCAIISRKGKLAGTCSFLLGAYNLISADGPALFRPKPDNENSELVSIKRVLNITSDTLMIGGGAMIMRGRVVPGALISLAGVAARAIEEL